MDRIINYFYWVKNLQENLVKIQSVTILYIGFNLKKYTTEIYFQLKPLTVFITSMEYKLIKTLLKQSIFNFAVYESMQSFVYYSAAYLEWSVL